MGKHPILTCVHAPKQVPDVMGFAHHENSADLCATDRLNWFLKEAPNADQTLRNALTVHFQIFSKGLYNIKTDTLIYRNYCGMNTSHLHMPWVNVKGSTRVQNHRPPLHPDNLCSHLLWWTICWCYHRWWVLMHCNKPNITYLSLMV